jgi:rsbT co-antagonist protein RsbR
MNDRQHAIPLRTRLAANFGPEEEQMDQEPNHAASEEESDRRAESRAASEEEESDRGAASRAASEDEEKSVRAPSRAASEEGESDRGAASRAASEEEEEEGEPDRGAASGAASEKESDQRTDGRAARTSDEADSLLQELVAYLRECRTELREEWARRISDAELLGVMSDQEIFSEATEVYDNYMDALETGSTETLETYARDLSERIIPRGVETHEVIGIVLLLRDVLARSLFTKYQQDLDLLNRILDSYEPAANRIAVTVGVSFVEERERVIHEQQEAMRELSTPVLQLRERLLLLPIIGVLDSARARQLTEQLLGSIQENRATVVVIDITGVATIDRTVANHLVQTVEASRLMGASTILTGLSSEIAQTLVDLGVDLGMMKTVGDLQGGLVEAEWLAGYRGRNASDSTGTEN